MYKITKTCPECGDTLDIRKNRKTGMVFLGCSRYPECKHTESIPETIQMMMLGAPTLFDLDAE